MANQGSFDWHIMSILTMCHFYCEHMSFGKSWKGSMARLKPHDAATIPAVGVTAPCMTCVMNVIIQATHWAPESALALPKILTAVSSPEMCFQEHADHMLLSSASTSQP